MFFGKIIDWKLCERIIITLMVIFNPYLKNKVSAKRKQKMKLLNEFTLERIIFNDIFKIVLKIS